MSSRPSESRANGSPRKTSPPAPVFSQEKISPRGSDKAHLGLVLHDFPEKVDKPKFLGIVQRFGLMAKWKRFTEFHGISV